MRPLLKALLLVALAAAPAIALADIGDASKFIGTALTLYGAFTGNAALLKWGAALMFAGNVAGSIEARRRAKQIRARQIADINAGLQARNITLPTAEPPHRCGYGRCLTGGDVLAIFTTDKAGVREDGSTYTKPDALQHVVLHFQTRQAHAIHEVYIDNVPVGTLDGSGIPTGGAFASAGTATRTVQFTTTTTLTEPALGILTAWTQVGDSPEPRTVTISGGGLTLNGPAGELVTVDYTVATSGASVRISKFLGSPTQTADAYLQSVVPTKWTANHRLRGLAGIVITLDLEDPRFQGGLPNITAEGSWARVYDPRKDSTVPGGSGTHRADDPSTWEWSDNNALCTADWLASELGYGVSMAEDINAAYLIAAANACDVTMSLDDGAGAYSGKHYTCNGAFTSDDNREQVLQDLEESMAGVAVPAGQWCVMAGAWTPPVAALGDADLAGSIEVLQADTATDDLINSARGRYIAAGKSQPSDANPPYSNPVLVAADEGVPLWTGYTFPFTNSNARVRNLLRINVERKRSGLTIQYPAKLRHWGLQVGERLSVSSSTYGFDAKTFRITDRRTTQKAPVIFTLQEDAAEIWDEADAATADPTPNTGLPDPYTVAPVASLAAASGDANLLRTADGTIVPQVLLSWAAITDSYVVPRGRILVRWRLSGSLNWQALAPLPGDATQATISGVKEGDSIVAEVVVRNALAQLSEPAYEGHFVTGKTTTVEVANASNVTVTDIASTPVNHYTTVATVSFTPQFSGDVLITASGTARITTAASGAGQDTEVVDVVLSVDDNGAGPAVVTGVAGYYFQGTLGFSVTRDFPVQFIKQLAVVAGHTYDVSVGVNKIWTASTCTMRALELRADRINC